MALQGSKIIATERHLHLAARAQVGLVRVRLWTGASPVEGVVLFNGSLQLDDGVVCVGDALGATTFRQGFGRTGTRRILVSADDPGNASRIDVVLDPGTREVALTSCRDRPIPLVRVADSVKLDSMDELGLILSAHDVPINRLAAALKLIFLTAENDDGVRSSAMTTFRIRMIGEWARWVSPAMTEVEASSIVSFISKKLPNVSPVDVDSFSVGIAFEVMARAEA
ncbi:hypothetical protein ACIA9I_07775 [Streptomyces anulatus]